MSKNNISIRSQKYWNVIKKVKNIYPQMYMCCKSPTKSCKKSPPLKSSNPLIAYSAKCIFLVPSAAFPIISAHTWEQHYGVNFLRIFKDMNYWTHSSSWRLWFTCNAPANSRAPMFEIWFPLRLQNVREQDMRGGSTNLFTLCKVYLVLVAHYWDTVETLCDFLSVSGVEDYKYITITTVL